MGYCSDCDVSQRLLHHRCSGKFVSCIIAFKCILVFVCMGDPLPTSIVARALSNPYSWKCL